MASNSRTWIWIVGTIVVVVGVIALAIFLVKRQNHYVAPVSGPTPAYAPAGQLVAGFPADLLIDTGAAITKSYALAYSSTTSQYTVQWNSSSSPQSLVASYALYLQSNGWRIMDESTSSLSFRSLYASGQSGTINLTATWQGIGSAVVFSYIPASQTAALPPPALPSSFPAFLVPAGSSTLVVATSTGPSTMIAIFNIRSTVSVIASSFLSAFKTQKWTVSMNQENLNSAFIAASSGSSQASVGIQGGGPMGFQVQIRYESQ